MKILIAALAVSIASAQLPPPPPPVKQASAFADFHSRIAAYLALTNTATDKLPPLKRTDDPSEIATREVALGNAIRAARADAKPGDILTPAIAHVFRRIVKNDFRRRRPHGQKVMRDEIPHFRPKINQVYPSAWPLATFPATVLAALPLLPEGLEYRLLSEALILRDVKANIIVDFILDVF
jgi:hypothetical protein